MKGTFFLLLFILLARAFATDCIDTGECTSLASRSTQNFAGKGVSGSTLRVTNLTSYNLLAPFPNPDWPSFLNSGNVNSCSILSRYWSGWSDWSACSRSCGGGTQSRSRSCILPSGGCGDAPACSGSSTETQSCNTHSCCSDYNISWRYTDTQYYACSPCPPWSGIGSCGSISGRSGTDSCDSAHNKSGSSCRRTSETFGSCGTKPSNARPGVINWSCSATCRCK